jgi:PII-like signaling protein
MKRKKIKQLIALNFALILGICGCASQNESQENEEQETTQNTPIVAAILDSVQEQEDEMELQIDLYPKLFK